ncbi:COBRA-like protein 4 [Hibiscus syriacus]|uniref:COBRA-like protein 4 n=1 Tax=Hibiscus syriacus TaxID=106335 RepID=A0A6A2WGZ5_HIBSY|nr:COBRA-like protein 4 [Hibiscus syriacus]
MVSCLFSTVFIGAYDSLDPTGNIIKWDIMSWTPDGYVIRLPKKEVIWSMVGAQATEQGDCSKFNGNIPHCCKKKNPTVVDLLPGVPYNQQIANCCRGGVVSSWGQDSSAAVLSFQLSIGNASTSNKTVKLPLNFTLLGPGLGYTCSQAKKVWSTVFISADGRRKTQAMSKFFSPFILASRYPSCCVSMSSFYNSTITPCPACSCGCQNKNNCISWSMAFIGLVDVLFGLVKGWKPWLLDLGHHVWVTVGPDDGNVENILPRGLMNGPGVLSSCTVGLMDDPEVLLSCTEGLTDDPKILKTSCTKGLIDDPKLLKTSCTEGLTDDSKVLKTSCTEGLTDDPKVLKTSCTEGLTDVENSLLNCVHLFFRCLRDSFI